MKKIKKLQPTGIYLIRSQGTANSTYFESEEELKIFWLKFNQILKKYLKVIDYHLGPDGFEMIIKIQSESKIVKEYLRHKKSIYGEYSLGTKENWRIISEKMQIFLGQLVKTINKHRGCQGSRTRCRFERYIFESKEEFNLKRDEIKASKVNLKQPRKKYRRIKNHFTVDKQDKTIQVLWNSKGMCGRNKVESKMKRLIYNLVYQRVKHLFERDFITHTFQLTHQQNTLSKSLHIH